MARRGVIGAAWIVRAMGALALLIGGSGCSILAFDKSKSIAGWYVGPPEIVRPVSATELEAFDSEMPPFCGLLQAPELLSQPLVGWTDPEPTSVSDDSIDEAFARVGKR